MVIPEQRAKVIRWFLAGNLPTIMLLDTTVSAARIDEVVSVIRDELCRLRRIEARAQEIAAADRGLLSTLIAARRAAEDILAAGSAGETR